MKKIRRQVTFANVVACLALFVALGGASYAALKLPKGSVGARQLKKGAVTASKVKLGSLLAKDFKSGQLPGGATGPVGPTGPQGPPGTSIGAPTAALPHARIALLDNPEPITSGGREGVAFDTVVEDNAGMADLSKRPGTLLVPRTGLYFVAADFEWHAIKGAGRMGGLIQGTKDPAGAEFFRFRSVDVFARAQEPLNYLSQPLSEVIRLNAGQYVALVAFQETGSTNELTFEGDGTWLEVTYLGA